MSRSRDAWRFAGFAVALSTSSASAQPPSACAAVPVDWKGTVLDPSRTHASLSRTLPRGLGQGADDLADVDALSWRVTCEGKLPETLRVVSERPGGGPLDVLEPVLVKPSPCASAAPPGSLCGTTPPIRATVDDADRLHPGAREGSVLVEVGGSLAVALGDTRLGAVPVGGPRESAVGPVERLRATLRVHVIRSRPGGEAPLGAGDVGTIERVRREVRAASMLWGQCGIHFGPPAEVEVRLVDPPMPHLVSLGCEMGLPASGGDVHFVVDGTAIRVAVPRHATPDAAAELVARAVRRAGFVPVVSPNARIAPAALRSVDVLVHRKNGKAARVESEPGAALSTDATLSVCIGQVDLENGLAHFDDLDAAAGTLEERTLVKRLLDGDPRTIDVVVIPSFASTGRIGESFIDEAGSAMKNLVLVDRAGIRASSRSYALPHELGHVLLALPGHPDDFGVDQPWALMDADSTDGSIFGPRRLSREDCERAVRQSGPGAPVPLLSPWPIPRD